MSKYSLLLIFWISFIFCNAQVKQDSVYKFVEQMPSFPGEEIEYTRFIGSNLDLSGLTEEDYTQQGRISIQFIVEADGTLSNIDIKTQRGKI